MIDGKRLFIYSSISSIVASVVTHPLDVLRTRAHVGNVGDYSGLYSGIIPGILSIVPSKIIFLTLHDILIKNHTELVSVTLSYTTSTIIMNPIYSIKTYMQLNNVNLRTCVNIFRNDIKLIYGGMLASMLGLSEMLIYFQIYSRMKDVNVLYSSFTSKLIATCITYPHEVIRTRMRHNSKLGLYDSINKGMLYSGFWRHLCKTVPNSVIIFTIYEYLKRSRLTIEDF